MADHRLALIPLGSRFAICRLDRDAVIPAWAAGGEFASITRTAEELSIVCPAETEPLVGTPDSLD